MNIALKVKKLRPEARIPAYQTSGAAGLDLYASEGVVIPAHGAMPVPLGIAVEIPSGFEGQIRPRSGLARAGYVGVFGTIDSDYRGEILALLENRTGNPFSVRVGDRIAQLVVAPVVFCEPVEVPDLSDTQRGAQGFGSTGIGVSK